MDEMHVPSYEAAKGRASRYVKREMASAIMMAWAWLHIEKMQAHENSRGQGQSFVSGIGDVLDEEDEPRGGRGCYDRWDHRFEGA